MNFISTSTSESRSSRFETFHRRLGKDVDRLRAHGALWRWRETWAERNESDHGIFWDKCLTDMGRWADWPDPMRFGGALSDAGYIGAAEDRWPAELRQGQEGIVALADRGGLIALDCSWGNFHSRTPEAARICWFLTDEATRLDFAVGALGLKAIEALAAEGRIPSAWYALAAARGERRRYQDLNKETLFSSPPYYVPPPPNPLCATSTSDGTEWNGNERERKGTGTASPTDGRTDSPPQGTGNRKSFAMLDQLRELKNSGDALRALLLLDATERAAAVWRGAVQRHRSEVLTMLSEITQSDEAFAKIKNPAALAMARLRKLG